MIFYTAMCGNWASPETIKRLPGTFSRKEIFAAAHELANETGLPVTIYLNKPDGMFNSYYEIDPEREGK